MPECALLASGKLVELDLKILDRETGIDVSVQVQNEKSPCKLTVAFV